MNLSRIRHKRLLRFLSKLGNMLPFGVKVVHSYFDSGIHILIYNKYDLSIILAGCKSGASVVDPSEQLSWHGYKLQFAHCIYFFYKYEVNKSVALLLVILPENISSHGMDFLLFKLNTHTLPLFYWQLHVQRCSDG